MSKALEKLQNCMRCIREKTDFQPEVALILGSGLGDYAESIDIRAEVSYHDIEGFPVSTVPRTQGSLCLRLCKSGSGGHHAGPRPLL